MTTIILYKIPSALYTDVCIDCLRRDVVLVIRLFVVFFCIVFILLYFYNFSTQFIVSLLAFRLQF